MRSQPHGAAQNERRVSRRIKTAIVGIAVIGMTAVSMQVANGADSETFAIDVSDAVVKCGPSLGTCLIGNHVFLDANNSGVFETGEAGISGTPVHLWNDNADTGRSTVTDSLGLYSFFDLVPSDSYQICVDLPTGYRGSNGSGDLTPGQDDTTAPDPNNFVDNDDNGRISTPAGRLCSGYIAINDNIPNNGRVDFGMYVPGYALGDRIFLDANNSAVLDAGENGIAGVGVQLWENNANTGTSTTTDAGGFYSFSGLNPSTSYQVCIDVPAGYQGSNGSGSVAPGQTDSEAPDPNNYLDNDDNGRVSTPTGRVCSGYVTLGGSTAANNRVDFGLYAPASTTSTTSTTSAATTTSTTTPPTTVPARTVDTPIVLTPPSTTTPTTTAAVTTSTIAPSTTAVTVATVPNVQVAGVQIVRDAPLAQNEATETVDPALTGSNSRSLALLAALLVFGGVLLMASARRPQRD